MDSVSSSIVSNAEATEAIKALLNSGGNKAQRLSDSPSANKGMDDCVSLGSTMSHGELGNMAEFLESSPRRLGKQTIEFSGSDQQNSFSIFGRDVTVVASQPDTMTQSMPGSNKVRINTYANFDWEYKYYQGDLVACHKYGLYFAYAMRSKNLGTNGCVRVCHLRTHERALIKDLSAVVVDIAFAHTRACTLGIVDRLGNMYIHEITQDESTHKLSTQLLLQVNRYRESPPEDLASVHRIIWCPYIPEDEESDSCTETESGSVDDACKLLVLTHDTVAEMWNLEPVMRSLTVTTVHVDEVQTGLVTIISHIKPILTATFSPDGTALATASEDGSVRFYQVDTKDPVSPRCLHNWLPHEGRPVSCLHFLDDHKHANPDVQFWKFAVTGCDQNREIRLWSCESWTCLQVLSFQGPLEVDPLPSMKAALDCSSQYLVLSDIARKVLYILQIYQNPNTTTAHVSSISEFSLAHPLLSFAILDAKRKKIRKSYEPNQLFDGEQQEDDEEEGAGREVLPTTEIFTIVKLFGINAKSIQQLEVRYQPESSANLPEPSSQDSVSHDEGEGYQEFISDMSGVDLNVSSDVPGVSSKPPVLLTPDAFSTSTSPRKEIRESVGVDSTRSSTTVMSGLSSLTHVSGLDDDRFASSHSSRETSVGGTLVAGGSAATTPTKDDLQHTSTGSLPKNFPYPEGGLRKSGTPPAKLPVLADLDSPASFYTSSPAVAGAGVRQEFKPPGYTGGLDNWEGEQEEGKVPPSVQRQQITYEARCAEKRDSDGSASAASLEVSEIMEKNNYDTGGYGSDDEDGDDEEEEDGDRANEEEKEDMITECFQPLGVDTEDDDVVPVEDQEEEEEIVEVIQAETEEEEGVDNSQASTARWPTIPDIRPVNGTYTLQTGLVHTFSRSADSEGEAGSVTVNHGGGGINTESEGEQLEEFPPPGMTMPHGVGATGFNYMANTHVHQQLEQQKEQMHQLQNSLQQLLGLVHSQQRQMDGLRNQLSEQQQVSCGVGGLQAQLNSLEGLLTAKVSETLSQHSHLETSKLQQMLGQREQGDRQKHDALVQSISQTLERTVAHQLETIVREEVRNIVVPGLAKLLDPITRKLHEEMAQKLTMADHVMKDSISRMVKSKATIEVLAGALGDAVQGPVHGACRDILIPAFDKSCQMLYQQMNKTFHQGLQEYTQSLENHLERLRQRHEEGRDPVVRQLHSVVENTRGWERTLQGSAQQLQDLGSSISKQVEQSNRDHSRLEQRITQQLTDVRDSLKRDMERLVRDEIVTCLQDQQSHLTNQLIDAMRAGANTPAPHEGPTTEQQKAHLQGLLKQGQYNSAFQEALQAADLDLLVFTCEMVEPSVIFTQHPCPLQQPVLLSLIQQLSADLSCKVELKHKYLEEAVMNLDQTSPITREHTPAVLNLLCQKLLMYIQANPVHRTTRSMRMLLMAAQSLLR